MKKKVDIVKTDIGHIVRIDGEYVGSCVYFAGEDDPYVFQVAYGRICYRGRSVEECVENYLSSCREDSHG